MLIVFEGIRKSGKSTLSLAFLDYINNDFRNNDGTLRVDPHLGDFVWTKEPTFPDEEADDLNLRDDINEFLRERIFFESRIKHQDILMGKNIICEQYLWCALAHSHRYSPNSFELIKELYVSEFLFVQPDLYVFIDTNPDVCYKRNPKADPEILKEIRDSYLYTRQFISCPVLTISSVGEEEKSIYEMKSSFENFVEERELADQEW